MNVYWLALVPFLFVVFMFVGAVLAPTPREKGHR